jgi:NADH dehydrogenase/NADH:ubiquinone oxidoreductase subunit G
MPSRPKSKEAQAARDALVAASLRLYLRPERVKAHISRQGASALAEIPALITADLRRADVFEAAQPETRLSRLKDFSSDAAATLQDAYKSVWKKLRADLATVAKRVGAYTLGAMNEAAAFGLAEYALAGDVPVRSLVAGVVRPPGAGSTVRAGARSPAHPLLTVGSAFPAEPSEIPANENALT